MGGHLDVLIHAPESIESFRVRLQVAEGSICVAHLFAHQSLQEHIFDQLYTR